MNHLFCEHCDHVGLDVMPLAVAITTGSKNIPSTYQKNLCNVCASTIQSQIYAVMMGIPEGTE